MTTIILTFLFSFILNSKLCAQELYESRVASIFVSQDFINEQLSEHLKTSEMVQNLKLKLDSATGRLALQGDFILPIDDIRAIGFERDLARFKFQLAIHPKMSSNKHLILEFPLSETYFYQANSKSPHMDRVIIPVQLLSLGLAATRGYLAALSGDFSSFDRKIKKYKALLKVAERSIKTESNQDALDILKSSKKSLQIQIASTELEKESFARTSKTLNSIFAFSSEKDFNLKNQIYAQGNVVMLKIKLSKLVPYLSDIELGDIRMGNSNPDNSGDSFLILDVNTLVTTPPPPVKITARKAISYDIPPALMIRLSQDVFTSKMMLDKESQTIGDIKDFKIRFKSSGIHISGKMKKFFMTIPFEGLIDLDYIKPDVFEMSLRKISVFNIDLKVLTPIVLSAMKDRLTDALEGICTYKYIGKKDESRVLQVKIKPEKLLPAFPKFHLTGVDVRARSFMLKIGRVTKEK